MPYASDKQRRYMWAKHPEIAKKWAKEGHGYVKGKKKKKKKHHSKGGLHSGIVERMKKKRS